MVLKMGKAIAIGLAGALCMACSASLAQGVRDSAPRPTATTEEDCFAQGDVGKREACFARKPDIEIEACERARPNACKPYKDMHALEMQRVQLSRDLLTKARSSYASYTEDDPAYLDDLASYLKDSDATWGAYRDADCLLEPFAQGMSRQEASDLTEACRIERTQTRIAELKALAAALK
ncbi:lysozyme inhibitor LprI family protein [Lysobacter sp. CCNWLW3]|uniref:lysozyme inhibitor LprI family protein n=1 Tax=unclassified Lysobacter TaxID=2635362 RepID=UPI002FD177FC